MVEKVNIDLDEAFLTKFFGLSDRMIPDGQEITLLMLRRQLDEISEMLETAKKDLTDALSASSTASAAAAKRTPVPAGDSFTDMSSSFDDGDQLNLPKKNILVIDDLGVITYQLGVTLNKMGFGTVTSKEIYDAIEKFKKQDFDLVIMDLFIPTEREGFILLEELKKTSANKKKPTKIGVMSASAKKEHKQMCKVKGAEFYIEKIDDWQKDLLSLVHDLF